MDFALPAARSTQHLLPLAGKPAILECSQRMVRSVGDLEAWEVRRRARLQRLVQEARQKEELQEALPFHPQINPKSRQLAGHRPSRWECQQKQPTTVAASMAHAACWCLCCCCCGFGRLAVLAVQYCC